MHKSIALIMATLVVCYPAIAQPISVLSDSRAKYTALDVKAKDKGLVEILTRREGPSGTSFARREIDCANARFRYLGQGDTREQAMQAMQANMVDTMGPLTDGSISTYVAAFACAQHGGLNQRAVR